MCYSFPCKLKLIYVTDTRKISIENGMHDIYMCFTKTFIEMKYITFYQEKSTRSIYHSHRDTWLLHTSSLQETFMRFKDVIQYPSQRNWFILFNFTAKYSLKKTICDRFMHLLNGPQKCNWINYCLWTDVQQVI